MGTDRDWENWGKTDPYYGVLTDTAYRGSNLTDQIREKFFASGESHVQKLLSDIRSHFDSEFKPRSSLDFGCGVGRILIPLAKQSEYATGVDVSASMRAEALQNCRLHNLDNVEIVGSDDGISEVSGDYDIVHSHIVFAHIAPARGFKIIDALARKVRPRGFIAIQVLYSCNAPRFIRALVRLRYKIGILNALRNLLRGRPLREPAMQLHVYSLTHLLRVLGSGGFSQILMLSDTFDNGQFDSVFLIARKSPESA